MRTFFRWLRSAEGPFSRKPHWLKIHIKNIANLLGVGIYVTPDWQRALLGQYVALHKDECLFLAARVDLELLILSERNGAKHEYTDYVIERLFGTEGRAAIEEAFVRFETDGVALAKAKDRATALVAAAFADASSLKELPEYFDGIAWGKKLSAMSTDFELGNDFERAYYGLHARYSSHLFTTEAFAEWIDVQVKGVYATEVLGRLSRTLDAAASGNLSGKDAAKIIGAKSKIK